MNSKLSELGTIGFEYPLREIWIKQQVFKYREVNPDITEEDYRNMIFGSPEGSKSIKDPSEGAHIKRVGEAEIVDVVESDFMEIGKVINISDREMEERDPVEDPTPSVIPQIEIGVHSKSTDAEIPIKIDSEIHRELRLKFLLEEFPPRLLLKL